VATTATQFLDSDTGPGEGGRCGPYELVHLLGRGGMGAVFLAKRTDGEVEQRVAIKFVRNASEEPAFRDRFLRERQILASLSHPGIARLLDAGHTSAGQPYLVMEYVDGIPIDVYAEALDLRGKLRLFLLVCDAISYAHRNLVIHRDLKPSNILVEAGGQPKLLDFGIARILDEQTDRSLTREVLLTPDYASPEQVRGAAHTTATDVYSLAAVLYRLLTGRSPHTPADGRAESVEALICLTESAAPSRWNRTLPRDLDFVLAKALRKEPEQRYAAVDALAGDVRAVLESRPVQARSGSAWYRVHKFLRRHWLPAAAVAAALLSLSIGLYIANRERTIAQRRFLEVRQLANKLFDIDALARQLPGSTKTRQFIVDTSLEYLGRLAADARGDPGLALEVGNAYMRVARVQGVPIGPNLGHLDQAAQNLQIADGFIHSVLQVQPEPDGAPPCGADRA
jgi:tRNA A-37 threonylcarbamoyl transferase component Bud32